MTTSPTSSLLTTEHRQHHRTCEIWRPSLLPPASSVKHRFEAAAWLHAAGLPVVITVSPLLPIEHPERFFERIAAVADAVVIDHFIAGDGTPDGAHTRAMALSAAMADVEAESVTLAYCDQRIALARTSMPGRVGVNIDGFAGRFLP